MNLMQSGALTKLIGLIGKRGTQVSNMIQVAAIQAIGYSIVHGDIGFGQRLYDAMPAGTRKDSLMAYLELNGHFAVEGKGKAAKIVFKNRERTFDPDALKLKHWNDAKRESVHKSVFDVSEEFDKFFRRMKKLADDATMQVKHKELLGALLITASKFNAEEFDREALAHLKASEGEGESEEATEEVAQAPAQ